MADITKQYRYRVEIIKPAFGENLVKNPSPYYKLEGYTGVSSVITLSDTYARREARCIKVEPTGSGVSGVYYSPVPHTNARTYTFSVDVKGTAGQAMRIYIANSGGTALSTTQFIATGNWQRVAVTWTATSTAANARVYVIRDAVISTDPFWVDGFQFEVGTKATTYIQGWQPGLGYIRDGHREYWWSGQPGSSTSGRLDWTRHGGELVNLSDYASIMAIKGLGMGEFTQVSTGIVTGGALYQKHLRKPRKFSITVEYQGANMVEIQQKRKRVLGMLRPDATPYDQPLVLRVQTLNRLDEAAGDPVDIECVLETCHQDPPQDVTSQRDTLVFTALDGHLRGAFWQGKQFEMKTEFDASFILRRDPDGRWTNSASENPLKGVVGGKVEDILEAPNGDIYIRGDFTQVQNGGVTVVDTEGLARWSKANQQWESVGTRFGLSPSATRVFPRRATCMQFDASGNLYAELQFDDNAASQWHQYIFAKYTPSGNSWTLLAQTSDTSLSRLETMVMSPDGVVHVTGANAYGGSDGTSYWDGSAFQLLTPVRGYAMKFHPDGRLIIGGTAANMNGTYICWWDGTSIHPFTERGATELNGPVYSIDITPASEIVIGGTFSNAGGDPNAYAMAIWNGTNWQSIGGAGVYTTSGIATVNKIYCAGSDIYAAGSFNRVANLAVADQIAVYSKGAWKTLDILLPRISTVRAVRAVCKSTDGYLYIGGSIEGTAIAPHITEVMYETTTSAGSANTYPHMEITGPGALQGITNHTTGRSLTFNGLTLLEGEKVWLSLDPTNLKIWSSWEGRGSVWRYLNAGSDIGDFYIQPGWNKIGLFMPTDTTLDTTGWIKYQPRYWSIEGAIYG